MITVFVDMEILNRNPVHLFLLLLFFLMITATSETHCAVLVPVFQAACLKLEGQGRTRTFIK